MSNNKRGGGQSRLNLKQWIRKEIGLIGKADKYINYLSSRNKLNNRSRLMQKLNLLRLIISTGFPRFMKLAITSNALWK